jgi:hypothetical protein
MLSSSRNRNVLSALLLAGALLVAWKLAGIASEHGRETSVPASAEATAIAPTMSDGMRAYIDPATGKLKEQPEWDEIAAAPARTTFAAPAAPKEFAGADGSVGMALGDTAMSTVVATRNPDGTVSLSHADGIGTAVDGRDRTGRERRDDR